MIITVPYTISYANASVMKVLRTSDSLLLASVDLRSITNAASNSVSIDSQYSNVTAPGVVGISYGDNNHIALDSSKCTSPVYATPAALVTGLLTAKDAAP